MSEINEPGGAMRVNVREFGAWVPHRPPAVWVDAVVRAQGAEGECRVTLDPDAAYVSKGCVRPSSYIEWIAQAYGYVQAAQLSPGEPGAERVFLAAVKNLEIERELGPLEPLRGREMGIVVKKTHQIGPIALVQGQVLDWDGKLIARAELKLFAG